MPNCQHCGIPFTDNPEVISVAFYDDTSDLNLAYDPYWVEVTYHLGMTYFCVLAQVTLYTRGTFGQMPIVTTVEVLADDEQWEEDDFNNIVDIQGVESFAIIIYCTFLAPVRGI